MDTNGLAKILWDYHHMNHVVESADCILVLGSHDTRVAERGAELYLEGWAPIIGFSGGLGRLTKGMWDRPEANIFADIAINAGVPGDRIILEDQSTNTGENILFSKEMLVERGSHPAKILAVHKPYMERRTYATFRKLWPEVDVVVTSPQKDFETYCDQSVLEGVTCEDVIHIMVGDLQRIKLYPQKGFQIEQEIPPDVWAAYEKLVELGYTRHLVR